MHNIGVIGGEWGFNHSNKIPQFTQFINEFVAQLESQINTTTVLNQYHYYNGGILWKLEQIFREQSFEYLILCPIIKDEDIPQYYTCLKILFNNNKYLLPKHILTTQPNLLKTFLLQNNITYMGNIIDIYNKSSLLEQDTFILKELIHTVCQFKELLLQGYL